MKTISWDPELLASLEVIPATIAHELALSENEMVLEALAANPVCPSEVLRQLAARSRQRVTDAVVRNANSPSDVLMAIYEAEVRTGRHAADGYSNYTFCGLAENPSTPQPILRELAAGHISYRNGVAMNPAAPGDLIVDLCLQPELGTSYCAAQNPSLGGSIAHDIAIGDDEWARRGLAQNMSCPPEVLSLLAHDRDERVRTEGVASNPSTPETSLVEMFNAERTASWESEEPAYLILSIVRNPNCPDWILREVDEALSTLWDSKSQRASWIQKERQSARKLEFETSRPTLEDLLEKLQSNDENERLEAAEDPRVTWDMIASADEVSEWRAAMSSEDPGLLERLASCDYFEVRQRVAANPSAPITVLERLSNDPEEDVLLAVACNATTPTEVLTRMTKAARYGSADVSDDGRDPEYMSFNSLDFIQKAAKENLAKRAGEARSREP